ncbi:MAG: HDOD domain-containing protein [Synechococcaceae cyanobacterium SM1_2_3]|nr:HDOD domain-containing protein [Synechococcaceae cyanobacterium SM1_2_3]
MIAPQQSLHELIVGIIKSRELQLPVFNPVALRLQQILSRTDVGIADIERMIVEDQALTSQILRVANAAFYQGLQPITTIRKAIIRLGNQQVANLAMVAAQQQMYQKNQRRVPGLSEKAVAARFRLGSGQQMAGRALRLSRYCRKRFSGRIAAQYRATGAAENHCRFVCNGAHSGQCAGQSDHRNPQQQHAHRAGIAAGPEMESARRILPGGAGSP